VHSKSRLVLCVYFLTAAAATSLAAAPPPVKLIFDTDIESDVDDAGTVALLHALADRGEVDILAMGVSAKHRWCVPCLDALNTYRGRPDIPIGVVKGNGVEKGSKYAATIAREYPHDVKSNDDAPDAAILYRRILSAQPDQSVVLVTVGFLTNVRNLLLTRPDEHSPKTGKELVKQKMRGWVCMGGAFPKGREWNVFQDASASVTAIGQWPAPIVFSGYEIGVKVLTGPRLRETSPKNPVRRSYELYNGLKPRPSWDQTAVLYAVRGLDGGLADVWDISAEGTMHVNPDGSNEWRTTPKKQHRHLIRKMDPTEVSAAIEELMVAPPRHVRAGS
jgi:inosine-uridine nucleoside N-ribohydrolase